MDALAQSLTHSPELFPIGFEPRNDSVSFIKLSREDYSAASFLDARILAPGVPVRTLPFAQVAHSVQAADLAERCGFIFHIGHVGSTLLSRLMGRHPSIFALREPAVLRTLAEMKDAPRFEANLSVFLTLLSRSFAPGELPLVKATSFVSEIASRLLARPSSPKAIMILAPPETYLATILGGANAPLEAKMLAPSRLARLHHRIGGEAWRLGDMSIGETIAMAWACEASALAGAAKEAGDRVRLFEFDAFLENPAPALAAAFAHFGLETHLADLRAIIAGPDMRRYSKAPEHAYDAALRRAVLDDARRRERTEIARGLAWLERAASRFSPVHVAMAAA